VEVKSRAGKRTIGIPKPLLEALREHKKTQDIEREFAGTEWREGGWVFAQPTGRPIDPRADHDEWKSLLAEAKVRDARLHDARHTAATMLLVLKVPLPAIMEVMGWGEASVAKRYVHVPTEVILSIAGQVEGLLWKAAPGSAKAPVATLTDDQRQALVALLAGILPGDEKPDDDDGSAGTPVAV
jgi:integrase